MPHTPLHGLLDAFIPAAEGSTGPQWAFEQEHNMKDYFKMLREKEKRENLLSSNIPEPATIVKGFVAPPPEVIDVEEGLSTEEEFAAQNKVAEMVDEEHPELLKEEMSEPELPEDDFEEIEFTHEDHGRGDVVMWANRTLAYIKDKGGVVNQYLKRFDLVPEDITKDERAEFKEELEDMGVNTYVVNQIRHFYYLGDGDGKEQYEEVYSK